MRSADKISRRVAALGQKVDHIPDPVREAAKKRRWEKAVCAFEHGDPNPPDDHPETLAMWDTLLRYRDVFLELRREGLI